MGDYSYLPNQRWGLDWMDAGDVDKALDQESLVAEL